MKLLHNIKISVFEYQDSDDFERIKPCLEWLCGFDIKKQLVIKKMDEFNDKNLITFELKISKQQQLRSIINNINENLTKEQKIKILNEKLDENLHYFFRFDKKHFLNKELVLTNSGICFHIRLNIAAYPKKKEIGLSNFQKLFEVKA